MCFPKAERSLDRQTGFVGLLCGGNGPPILKGLRVSDWRTKFDVHLHCHSAQLPLLATSVGAGVRMPWQCHEGKGRSGRMCTNMAKTSYWGDSISRQDFSVFNLFFHLSYFFLIHLMSWIWTFFHFEFLVSQLCPEEKRYCTMERILNQRPKYMIWSFYCITKYVILVII